jgi:hypothetical protein
MCSRYTTKCTVPLLVSVCAGHASDLSSSFKKAGAAPSSPGIVHQMNSELSVSSRVRARRVCELGCLTKWLTAACGSA